MKIGRVDPEIISLKVFIYENEGVHADNPLTLNVTGPKFTKFTHNIARLLQMNFLKI